MQVQRLIPQHDSPNVNDELIIYKCISTEHRNSTYQLPSILTLALQVPDKRCLSQDMCLYQVLIKFHFLDDVANDAE